MLIANEASCQFKLEVNYQMVESKHLPYKQLSPLTSLSIVKQFYCLVYSFIASLLLLVLSSLSLSFMIIIIPLSPSLACSNYICSKKAMSEVWNYLLLFQEGYVRGMELFIVVPRRLCPRYGTLFILVPRRLGPRYGTCLFILVPRRLRPRYGTVYLFMFQEGYVRGMELCIYVCFKKAMSEVLNFIYLFTCLCMYLFILA